MNTKKISFSICVADWKNSSHSHFLNFSVLKTTSLPEQKYVSTHTSATTKVITYRSLVSPKNENGENPMTFKYKIYTVDIKSHLHPKILFQFHWKMPHHLDIYNLFYISKKKSFKNYEFTMGHELSDWLSASPTSVSVSSPDVKVNVAFKQEPHWWLVTHMDQISFNWALLVICAQGVSELIRRMLASLLAHNYLKTWSYLKKSTLC